MLPAGAFTKQYCLADPIAAGAGALLVALALFLLAGCGVPSLPTVQTETVDAAALTGGAVPAAVTPGDKPANMTLARWAAPADRLADDIPRAVKRHEWAVLHVEPAVEANLPGASLPKQAMSVSVLLPDDREATILAWRLAENEVAVAVRVGYFGDPAAERGFLARLRDVMADKPKPKRGGTFELP